MDESKVKITGLNGEAVHPGTMYPDKIKVLFAIPRGSFTLTEAVDNQIDMAFHLGKIEATTNFKFFIATIGRLFVAKAREEFAEYTLGAGCDYLFMVDDDMICPPDLFLRLYNHNVDIVAPLAFQRREPYYPVIYKQKSGWDAVRKEHYFANEIVKNYPKNTLFQCDAVGFGAVLIKRWVLESMRTPRFMSTSPTGEDILFCYNAREQVNAKVFADTDTKIAHLGAPKIITEETYEEFNNTWKMREVYGEYNPEFHKVGI
jgi:hypothetical protein